jgi:hypothetical protein
MSDLQTDQLEKLIVVCKAAQPNDTIMVNADLLKSILAQFALQCEEAPLRYCPACGEDMWKEEQDPNLEPRIRRGNYLKEWMERGYKLS